jgi:hypothetical protein
MGTPAAPRPLAGAMIRPPRSRPRRARTLDARGRNPRPPISSDGEVGTRAFDTKLASSLGFAAKLIARRCKVGRVPPPEYEFFRRKQITSRRERCLHPIAESPSRNRNWHWSANVCYPAVAPPAISHRPRTSRVLWPRARSQSCATAASPSGRSADPKGGVTSWSRTRAMRVRRQDDDPAFPIPGPTGPDRSLAARGRSPRSPSPAMPRWVEFVSPFGRGPAPSSTARARPWSRSGSPGKRMSPGPGPRGPDGRARAACSPTTSARAGCGRTLRAGGR